MTRWGKESFVPQRLFISGQQQGAGTYTFYVADYGTGTGERNAAVRLLHRILVPLHLVLALAYGRICFFVEGNHQEEVATSHVNENVSAFKRPPCVPPSYLVEACGHRFVLVTSSNGIL